MVVAFYPRMPSGVVVKGRIEPAELQKVYGALRLSREESLRDFLHVAGIREGAIAYYRYLRS